MAWPFSPLRTYIAGSTPTIKASDLNSIQAYINHLFGGTRSVKSFTVDGTGDVDSSGNTVGAATLNGANADGYPAIETSATPTNYKLLWRINVGSSKYARIYSTGIGYVVTINAYNIPASTDWARDAAGNSSMMKLLPTGWGIYGYPSGSATPWTDADWGYTTPGLADLAYLLGTGMQSALGITAASGNVTATSGNLVATATPSGSAGPGLVKCSRLYGAGNAVVDGDFTPTGWSGADYDIDVDGTDMAGTVTITCGDTPALNPSIQLTFGDGTFTNTPTVIWARVGTDDPAGGSVPISWLNSPTATTVVWGSTPVHNKVYQFSWVVVGN